MWISSSETNRIQVLFLCSLAFFRAPLNFVTAIRNFTRGGFCSVNLGILNLFFHPLMFL
ncbi:hypothetical protein F4775DRAFT_552632 [Biscogniauxia sp. FL1348]|nr:hypothetical protein F4775DRAFT_552632 [Biscogniauxia sp. FL1348]